MSYISIDLWGIAQFSKPPLFLPIFTIYVNIEDLKSRRGLDFHQGLQEVLV